MQFIVFTGSSVSDCNPDHAQFLRGVASDLIRRRHQVKIVALTAARKKTRGSGDSAEQATADFRHAYPLLEGALSDEPTVDVEGVLDTADIVVVHEGNSRDLVRRIGDHHAGHRDYRLYFHDTHQHEVTRNDACDLFHYDAVLTCGNKLRDVYLNNGWAGEAVTWHQAVDTAVFRPLDRGKKEGDLVLIDNWAGNEGIDQLREFFIEPVKALCLKACVYGSGYPAAVVDELRAAGIQYGGWLPDYKVPEVFARYTATVYLPHRSYPGAHDAVPTIHPFEALACGIPLISAPWRDIEHFFRPGRDFLFAFDGQEMTSQLEVLLARPDLRASLIRDGLETIQTRHTCAHRAGELLSLAAPRHVAAMRSTVC
jgi:glycosyltransferase involved in cell wall biosynthesis